MSRVLIVDDDIGTLDTFTQILKLAGHQTISTSSGLRGKYHLQDAKVDVTLIDLKLPDISGLELLDYVRTAYPSTQCVIVTGFGTTKDAVTAMRLGAIDFLEKPIGEDILVQSVNAAVAAAQTSPSTSESEHEPKAHAAARWARVVVRVIDSTVDPRTIADWSRLVVASSGALRNWCRTARISPRRSLVFARLLRAAAVSERGRHKLENVLDVVDQRTLKKLLTFAGLRNGEADLCDGVYAFIQRQTLIRDSEALSELRHALITRGALHPHDPLRQE